MFTILVLATLLETEELCKPIIMLPVSTRKAPARPRRVVSSPINNSASIIEISGCVRVSGVVMFAPNFAIPKNWKNRPRRGANIPARMKCHQSKI